MSHQARSASFNEGETVGLSEVHNVVINRTRLVAYNQNRAAIESTTRAKTWARVLLFSDSLAEAKAMVGGYYMNVSLVATLMAAMAVGVLIEMDVSDATLQQRATLGISATLTFGLYLSCAVDCVLIDNSTRKLRSYQHFFIYLGDNGVLMANTMRLFSLGLITSAFMFVSAIDIVYNEITFFVLGLAIVMLLALARRFTLLGRQMDAFSAAEDKEIDDLTKDLVAEESTLPRALVRELTRKGVRADVTATKTDSIKWKGVRERVAPLWLIRNSGSGGRG